MGIPIWTDIVGPVVDKVLSFIPDPEQKAKAAAAAMQATMDRDQAFRDFVVEYEGAAKDVHPSLQFYRGSVRPTITYAAIIGLFVAIWTNQPAATLDMLFKINLLCLAFWFGERALNKLGLDLGRMGKK